MAAYGVFAWQNEHFNAMLHENVAELLGIRTRCFVKAQLVRRSAASEQYSSFSLFATIQSMKKRKPALDHLSDADRKKCIELIIAFAQDELGVEIGVIAAEDMLDSLQEIIAKSSYNRGVEDATKLFLAKFVDAQIELDLLKKR